jgi:hypothetical protein
MRFPGRYTSPLILAAGRMRVNQSGGIAVPFQHGRPLRGSMQKSKNPTLRRGFCRC